MFEYDDYICIMVKLKISYYYVSRVDILHRYVMPQKIVLKSRACERGQFLLTSANKMCTLFVKKRKKNKNPNVCRVILKLT